MHRRAKIRSGNATLFVAGSGDGNVRIMLFDDAGNSATAYIQNAEMFHKIGEWQEVTLSLKKRLWLLRRNLDVKNVKSVAVGFNILDHEENVPIALAFLLLSGISRCRFKGKPLRRKAEYFRPNTCPYNRAYILKDYLNMATHRRRGQQKQSAHYRKSMFLKSIFQQRCYSWVSPAIW